MDLREALTATGSLAPPSQQPPGLLSRDLFRRHGHGNPQNHACVYCRRSHMSCDLGRPCTRCIKRNIGHLCHDEPFETGLQKGKSAQPGQTAQTNTTSLPNSNLEICHYTISRDHTGGAEDQKCEILADFARKHTRAWTSISLANVNSSIANPETSPKGLRSLYGPGHYATHSELSIYAAMYPQNHQAVVQAQSTSITASTQSEPIALFDPSDAALFTQSIKRL